MKLEIQKIGFPSEGICTTSEMFYRLSDNKSFIEDYEKLVFLREKAVVSFNTYFGSFSIGKWMKYTKLNKLKIELEYEGEFDVKIYNSTVSFHGVVNNLIHSVVIKSETRTSTVLEIEDILKYKEGLIFFSITSNVSGSVYYGSSYYTDVDATELNDVKIAVNICTYMREAYVYKNIELFNEDIFCSDSVLKDKLKIFITDNGGTIEKGKVDYPWVHLVKQGDNGSAGGFTRGLIEIIESNVVEKFTNVIMMDDDVFIDTSSVKMNYVFLLLLKKEYLNATIGGALIRTDKRYLQHTSGGEWDKIKFYRFHKLNTYLNDPSSIILNEIEDNASVNGWWYCCYPMSVVREDNLPWPSYFHMDDMEYDIRNTSRLILMNGICTWHEPFEFKYSSYTMYFDSRNTAITHMVHYDDYTRWNLIQALKEGFFARLYYYKYREAKLVLKAYKDLLKGPSWLKSIDPIEYFEDLLKQGYKSAKIQDTSIDLDYINLIGTMGNHSSIVKRVLRKITMNGHLLPSYDKERIVWMFGPHQDTVFGAKEIHYVDEVTGKCFSVKKNVFTAIILLFQYWGLKVSLLLKFNRTRKAYRKEFPNMITKEFWDNYLIK